MQTIFDGYYFFRVRDVQLTPKSNETACQFATYFVTGQAHMNERWSVNRAQIEYYYDTVRPTL